MIWKIIKKELQSYFNSPIAYIILIVFVGVSGWFFAQDLFLGGEAEITGFIRIVPILFLLLIPGLCMRLIAEERSRGTIEVLSTLPLKDTDVILGKWIAALLLIIIGLGVTIIFPIIAAFLGNLDWGVVIAGYIGLILFAMFFTSIGTFASSITTSQIIAFVIGVFLSFFFFVLGKLLFFLPTGLVPFFNYLGIDHHLTNITRGLFDSRDLVYFFSLTFIFIYGALYFYQRSKQILFSTTQWILIGVILVLCNIILNQFFFRIDLTQGNIYSLSRASKKILKQLPDNVVVKAYITSKLPFPYNTHAQYVKDLLGEYRLHSKGKIKCENIDPINQKQIIEAQQNGIIPLQFTEVKQGEFGVKQGFMGLVFLFEDKREVIPVIENIANLEYDITSKIKKITEEEMKTIGFITGHDEIELSDNLNRKISERYRIAHINLRDTAQINCDAIVIAGPKRDFDTTEARIVFENIEKKIPVAFLIDRFGINLDYFISFPLKTPNLDSLMKKIGITIEQGLIMDKSNELLVLRSQQGMFVMQNYIPYLYFPKLTDLSKEHPITKDFEMIVLPYVSPVAGGDELARTSKASWLRNSPQSINPLEQQKFMPFPLPFDKTGPFNTMSCITADKRILVVGTSKFIDPQFLGAPGITLFMNILDWITQDETLISIRAKAVAIRPIKQISKGVKAFVQWSAPLIPSIIVVLIGVIRWRVRKGGRIHYEA